MYVTIPKKRQGNDIFINVSLKDSGVSIDWANVNICQIIILSEAQDMAFAGRCSYEVGENPQILTAIYSGRDQLFTGVHRIVLQAEISGTLHTYDARAFELVEETAETGETTIEVEPVEVGLNVEEISSSAIDAILIACQEATKDANEAAAGANNAAIAASDAADNADTAATAAINAANSATTAANAANAAAARTEAAAESATAAAEAANEAAGTSAQTTAAAAAKIAEMEALRVKVVDTTAKAETATTNANNATTNATAAATSANAAATAAEAGATAATNAATNANNAAQAASNYANRLEVVEEKTAHQFKSGNDTFFKFGETGYGGGLVVQNSNYSTVVTLTDDKKIGIGTIHPTEKLEVELGNIKTDGKVIAGSDVEINGESVKGKLTELESHIDTFEKEYGFLVVNNQYFDKANGVYGEVAIGSAGNIVVQTGNKTNIVFVSEINGKAGDTFHYATIGTSVDSLAQNSHRCFVYNESLIDENGNIVNGTTSLQRGSATYTTSNPLGGSITLAQDAKYFAFVLSAKDSASYPLLMDLVKNTLVMAKALTYPTEYVPFGKTFIPYEEWKGTIIEDCILKNFKEREVFYSEETSLTLASMANDWTGNLADGFNRAGGVISGEIVLNGNFVNGAKYVVILDATDGGMNFNIPSDKGIPFFVRIGNMLPTDVYNGTLHSEVVVRADNSGQLHLYGDDSKRWTRNLKIRVFAVSSVPTDNKILLDLKNIVGSSYDGYGKWNSTYGFQAMSGDFNGTRCVAIGYNALLGQFYGMQNVAIGTFALAGMYRGEHNIAIGSDAIYQTYRADDNIIIGKGAVSPVTSFTRGEAYKNVVIGHEALPSVDENVTGNVIIGHRAGQNSTNYNVFIGDSAHGSPKANRAIAIGHNATATKDNQMVLGSNEITEVVMMGNKKLIFNADGSVTWTTL